MKSVATCNDANVFACEFKAAVKSAPLRLLPTMAEYEAIKCSEERVLLVWQESLA